MAILVVVFQQKTRAMVKFSAKLRRLTRTACLAWPAIMLTSCSSGGESSSPQLNGSDESIFGLWNLYATPTEGDNSQAYFEVSENELVYYFHQGDNATNSRNCYFIVRDAIEFTSERTFIMPNRTDSGESDIQATLESLTISFVDSFDEDEDGDTEEILVESFTRVMGFSAVDLNECI